MKVLEETRVLTDMSSHFLVAQTVNANKIHTTMNSEWVDCTLYKLAQKLVTPNLLVTPLITRMNKSATFKIDATIKKSETDIFLARNSLVIFIHAYPIFA